MTMVSILVSPLAERDGLASLSYMFRTDVIYGSTTLVYIQDINDDIDGDHSDTMFFASVVSSNIEVFF